MNNLSQNQFDNIFHSLENYDANTDKIVLANVNGEMVPSIVHPYRGRGVEIPDQNPVLERARNAVRNLFERSSQRRDEFTDKFAEAKLGLDFLDEHASLIGNKDLSQIRAKLLNGIDNAEQKAIINRRLDDIQQLSEIFQASGGEKQQAPSAPPQATPSLQKGPSAAASKKPVTVLEQHNIPEIPRKDSDSIHQIKVADQREFVNGNSQCGFHAWKNALIALTLSQNPPPNQDLVQLFEDPGFFKDEVLPFLGQFLPANRGEDDDIPLSALDEATRYLQENEINQGQFPMIHRLKEMGFNKEHFSILDVGKEGESLNPYEKKMAGMVFPEDKIGVDTVERLDNITYGIRALRNHGPLTHTFICGTGAHWTTLIMNKDANDKITWFGTDSWGNQTKDLPIDKYLIEEWSKSIEFQQKILKRSSELMVEALTNMRSTLEPMDLNTIKHLSKEEIFKLVDSYDKALKNIKDLSVATKFLKENDLYDDPKYADTVAYLKKIAVFYQKYLEYLPDVDNQLEVNDLFDLYSPYAALKDSDEFANSTVAFPVIDTISNLYEASGLSFSKFFDFVKKLEPNCSLEDYSAALNYLLNYYSSVAQVPANQKPAFKYLLFKEGIIDAKIKQSQTNLIINELIKKRDQNPDLINQIKKIALEVAKLRVEYIAEKNKLDMDIIMPDNDQEAGIEAQALMVKSAIYDKYENDIVRLIDEDKEKFKEFLAQKNQLLAEVLKTD